MSISGRKSLEQTVLAWEWYKRLDEYGDADTYSKGWTLEIHTLFGTVTIQDYGRGMWVRIKRLIPSFRYGIYWAGIQIDYDRPDRLQFRYSGDAREPRGE